MKKLTIILEGLDEKITPQDVPAGELGLYMADIEAAILATAAHYGVDLEGSAFLTFDRVKEGSSLTVCRTTDQANRFSQRVFEAVDGRDFDALPEAATAALRRASERAKAMRRTLHIQAHGRQRQAALIDIPKQAKAEVSFVHGATTLYGQVTRIKADNQTAMFVTHAGVKVALVDVSASMARELGAVLLEDVELSATAYWDASTFDLVRVKPLAVARRVQDFGAALTALRSVSSDLSGVSVEAMLADLRGDE